MGNDNREHEQKTIVFIYLYKKAKNATRSSPFDGNTFNVLVVVVVVVVVECSCE